MAFGTPAAICALIVALLAIAFGAIYQSTAHVKEETQFRTKTEEKLTRIDGRLTGIENRLTDNEKRVLQISAKIVLSNPPNAENQAEAKDLLAVAKKESISLPLAIVEQGGQKSIEAAKGDPKAWSVALDFVSYRSSLNMRPSAAATAEPITGTETTHYTYVRVRGLDSPSLKWKRPLGPAAQATRWERIGENLNSNVPNQPTRLFAVGGGTSLDGEHIRNVVFESVEIHYSGAPVILESVVFINCVFVFDNNDHGRKLSKTLLAESNVNYRAPA